MAVTSEQVQRFAALYSGYTKALGRSVLTGRIDDRGKHVARSWTEHTPLTLALYEDHLEARTNEGLGVLILRDDNATCSFGAIDIDDYAANHTDIERKVVNLGLPVVIVRSKSGGAHLTCFLDEPVQASILQKKLNEWRALLGYPEDTEIFPKQTARAAGGDVGSFLNLPYFGVVDSPRYAVIEGEPLTLDEFLDYAEGRKVSTSLIFAMEYGPGKEGDAFFEGPPCLQHLHKHGGFVEGTKRLGMFDVGVYLRKRHPDGWEEHLVKYNELMCDPELKLNEITGLIKDLNKKTYDYQCKQPPISSHCQRKVCRTRRFGKGEAGPGVLNLEISAVTRYQVEGSYDDPPTWGMDVGGRRVLIDNSTFYERDSFNKAMLAQISRVPIHVAPSQWLKMVDEFAANAEVIYTAKEASQAGNLWEWVETYLGGAKNKSLEKVAVSGAYKEEGHVYFRIMDLFLFLDQRRIPYKSKPQVYRLLTDHGGKAAAKNFKTGTFQVWKVPLPNPSAEEDETVDFTQNTPF